MKKVVLRSVILIGVLTDSASLSLAETPEARTLSALAPKVVFLCDFATNFHASPELVSSWNALQDPSLGTSNLISLLKSQDPKIRALAIFALDRKNDPQVLPDIAALQSDEDTSVFLSIGGCPTTSSRQTEDLASGTQHGWGPGSGSSQPLCERVRLLKL